MKSNIKLFEETIENITVPGDLSYEKAMELTEPITNIVNDIMPKRLYRFRKCDELNIDAFNTDRIFVSRGIDVNDVYDTCLFYDVRKIENDLNKWNYDKIVDRFYKSEDIFRLVEQNLPVQSYSIKDLMSYHKDDIKKIIIDIQDKIKKEIFQDMPKITEVIQNETKFACFSQNINSPMMWGHYTDSSKGFALEYDFKNSLIDTFQDDSNYEKRIRNTALCSIYPVIYNRKKYDVTEYAVYLYQYRILSGILTIVGCSNYQKILNKIFPCPDNFKFSKIAIHKSLEWQYEKEWRLFYASINPLFNCEQHPYVYKTPVAIYLGRRISQINEKILKDIAREKNIKCYKMNMDNSIEDYKLIPELQTL